jgi:trimeric autotransporter adhesin
MLTNKRKLRVSGLCAVLVLLAFGLGCKGFFQNPVLQTVTVGPANLNLNQDSTQQMTATGTYDDGSTKNLSTDLVWSSSDATIASVSSSGVVTGVSVGTATITAEEGTVSGTASVTVALANVTSLKINPTTIQITANGGTASCNALATVSGESQPVDVSNTVTWSINSSDFVISQGTTPATITAQSTSIPGETATVTATYTSSTTTFTATATLTAN